MVMPMDGVTTAMIGFIFVCIIFPRLVRNSAQFYAAFGLIVLMLLLGSLAGIFNSESFWRFTRAVSGLLQLTSLVLLVLATGGLSLNELAGEFKGAFDAIRQGPDAGKPVIVPLTGAQPKPRPEDDEEARPVHTIEPPPAGVPPVPPPPKRPDDTGSIPLE
jgi:hypothetical protein